MSFDSYTKLMAFFNGADGAAPGTAETGQTLTAFGGAALDTAQKKNGTASVLLDANDGVTVPDSADWIFGTDPFTLDAWVRFNSTGSTYHMIASQGAGGGVQFMWYWQGNLLRLQIYGAGPAITLDCYCSWTPLTGQWYHVALCRTGSSWYMYIDGVAQSLTLAAGGYSANWGNYDTAFCIGIQSASGANGFDGWIDNFRVSNGICRWTSTFTPPATEDEYTAEYLMGGQRIHIF